MVALTILGIALIGPKLLDVCMEYSNLAQKFKQTCLVYPEREYKRTRRSTTHGRTNQKNVFFTKLEFF